MDRDEIVRRAAEYLRKRSSVWSFDPRMSEILADFLIEQSQAHGWLDMQMVFLAEAMERDCDEKLAKVKAAKGETDTWVTDFLYELAVTDLSGQPAMYRAGWMGALERIRREHKRRRAYRPESNTSEEEVK